MTIISPFILPKKNSSKRCGEIDILRFIFSVTILLFHFHLSFNIPAFVRSVGVEFFFIVSGYLMAVHAERIRFNIDSPEKIANETWIFIRNKISSFFRYYLMVFFLDLVIRNMIIRQVPLRNLIVSLLSSIPTITLTFMALNQNSTSLYVGNTWYLSAMLIAMFLLYPFLLRNFEYVTKLFFPILSLFLLGYLYGTYNTITGWDQWTGLFYVGVIRAVGEISFGSSLYQFVQYINEIVLSLNTNQRIIIRRGLTVVKICCYSVVLLFTYGYFNWKFNIHAFLICGLGITLSLSTASYSIKSSRMSLYLGKISLPIFIFHGFLRNSLEILLTGYTLSNKQYILMILLSIITCVFLMYLTDSIMWLFKKIWSQL